MSEKVPPPFPPLYSPLFLPYRVARVSKLKCIAALSSHRPPVPEIKLQFHHSPPTRRSREKSSAFFSHLKSSSTINKPTINHQHTTLHIRHVSSKEADLVEVQIGVDEDLHIKKTKENHLDSSPPLFKDVDLELALRLIVNLEVDLVLGSPPDADCISLPRHFGSVEKEMFVGMATGAPIWAEGARNGALLSVCPPWPGAVVGKPPDQQMKVVPVYMLTKVVYVEKVFKVVGVVEVVGGI